MAKDTELRLVSSSLQLQASSNTRVKQYCLPKSARASERRSAKEKERKSKASGRERARVRAMASAFRNLRERLPRHPAEYQLTQAGTVLRAMEYIKYLEKQLQGEGNSGEFRVHGDNSKSEDSSLSTSSVTSDRSLSDDDQTPSSLFSAISIGRLIPVHRVKWNVTCRQRSQQIAQAFDALRDHLKPAEAFDDASTQPTSQIHTLWRAIDYIRSLRDVLQDAEREEALLSQECNLLEMWSDNCDSLSSDDFCSDLLSSSDLSELSGDLEKYFH